MRDQYRFLWNWLLDKGIFIATIIVNLFAIAMFTVSMIALHFFIRWWDKFR